MAFLSKEDWLYKNGFSLNGITYCVTGDSYSIKTELKNAGFRYHTLLRWHCPNRDFELGENRSYKAVNFDDVFIWDSIEKTVRVKESAAAFLKEIFSEVSSDADSSEFVGEVGQRLQFNAEVTDIRAFMTNWGLKRIITFKDEGGNIFKWFTTTLPQVQAKDKISLIGTVVSHEIYQNCKYTKISRCVITKL